MDNTRMQACMEIRDRIAQLKEAQPRVLVTLDGPCASGKTTLAETLGGLLQAPVLHTDDFVVPHARKNPERLSIPGGNCDWERLTAEVLAPWKEGREPAVIRYDFRKDRFREPERLPETDVLILEGSYSNLPAIRALADLRIFVRTPEEVRRKRLQSRETEASLRLFESRWIPLENAYFAHYLLPDPDCLILQGG